MAGRITPLLQRQPEEEEELQMQVEPEEEEVQASILLRQISEEDEPVQTNILQRKVEDDTEIPVQASLTKIQRLCPKGQESLQRKGNGGSLTVKTTPKHINHASGNIETRINAMKGGGTSLPEPTRNFYESRFGTDFSQVRVHTDSRASETAKSINARAFTVGNNIAFGAGQYAPDTQAGKKLLGHELTHVVQQNDNISSSIQRYVAEPLGMSITSEYAKSLNDADLEIQIQKIRNYLLLSFESSEITIAIEENLKILEKEVVIRSFRNELQKVGILVSDDDALILANTFPNGINLLDKTIFITALGSNSTATTMTPGFQVFSKTELKAGVTTYILRPGHGRSIVVTSDSGPSVILDAGAKKTSGKTSVIDSINALLQARLINPSAYNRILVSHTDKDHINAVRGVLELSAMERTAIELTAQQYHNAIGRRDFVNACIQVEPNLVEVDIRGAVDTRQRIVGNMEITEFRLISAQQAVTDPSKSLEQIARQKNQTSPVTVIRDLITGDTKVFTADITGKAINEIIDGIGEAAFRLIIGGGSKNLKLAEAAHHSGKVGAGPNAAGMLRFIRLQYEASNGQTPFFAQSSTEFLSGASSSFRWLSLMGIPVEPITQGASGDSGSNIVRARAGQLHEVVIDSGRITQILEVGQTADSPLMESYSKGYEIERLIERTESLRTVLSMIKGSEGINSSLEQMLQGMRERLEGLQTSQRTFWESMLNASRSSGFKITNNLQLIEQAVARLRSTATKVSRDYLRGNRLTINTTEVGIALHARLVQNAVEMFVSLNKGEFRKLHELKHQQHEIMARVNGILGNKEFRKEVRKAWAETQAWWSRQNIKKISRMLARGASEISRQKMTQFRTRLGMNIGRRIELTEFVEGASHGGGGAWRGTPAATMRTRVGAGILAGIEVLRIGFDLWELWRSSEEYEEIEAQNRLIRGFNMVKWWIARGVYPEITLLDEDKDEVGMKLSQKERYQVIMDQYDGDSPEFDQVVVTWVKKEDREYAIGQLELSVTNLDEWHRLVEDERYERHKEGHTPLKRQDNKWYTLVWQDGEYKVSFDLDIHNRLESLHEDIKATQESELKYEFREEKKYSVEDTAWIFGEDRYVWIYDKNGRLTRKDFGSKKPVFVKVNGNPSAAPRPEGKILVKAANAKTYAVLRGYRWITGRQEMMSARGNYISYSHSPNKEGFAWVEEDDLYTYKTSPKPIDLPILSPTQDASAAFKKIWVEFNVKVGSKKGMLIHAKFRTENLQNQSCNISAYFYNSGGEALKDSNNKYQTVDGNVSTGEVIKPGYPSTVYNDFKLFMPYKELHRPTGEYSLKFRLSIYPIFKNIFGNFLAHSDYFHFTYSK